MSTRELKERFGIERPPRVRGMSVDEFEQIRFELGPPGRSYPKEWLADALGYSVRSIHRWLNPESPDPIPDPAAKLMRVFRHIGKVL